MPAYDFSTLLTKTSKKLPAASPDDLVVSITVPVITSPAFTNWPGKELLRLGVGDRCSLRGRGQSYERRRADRHTPRVFASLLAIVSSVCKELPLNSSAQKPAASLVPDTWRLALQELENGEKFPMAELKGCRQAALEGLLRRQVAGPTGPDAPVQPVMRD